MKKLIGPAFSLSIICGYALFPSLALPEDAGRKLKLCVRTTDGELTARPSCRLNETALSMRALLTLGEDKTGSSTSHSKPDASFSKHAPFEIRNCYRRLNSAKATGDGFAMVALNCENPFREFMLSSGFSGSEADVDLYLQLQEIQYSQSVPTGIKYRTGTLKALIRGASSVHAAASSRQTAGALLPCVCLRPKSGKRRGPG
jgi:hypothetical protein